MKQHRRGLLWWVSPRWAEWLYTVILKPAPLRSLARKLICLVIPEEIEMSGVTLVLNRDDAIVSGNIALGCYETYNLELFEKLLRPGMCVLDVGANIGLYSAIAARMVGTGGRVIAIEPEPTNCSFLRRTKERNGLANLTILQKAAGAESGETFLYLSSTNKADNRIFGDESRAKIRVELTTLDSIVTDEQVTRVDVLKIDTQGFELHVARGMEKLLEANHDLVIMMEFWPWGIAHSGGDPAELLQFFASRGFVISVIDATRKQIIPLNTFESILKLTLERQHADLYLERSKIRSAL